MGAMAAAPRPQRLWNVPLIAIGALVALGGFLASLYVGSLNTPASHALSATSPVVVAAHDLQQRHVLTAGDLSVSHYSAADTPPGAIGSVRVAVGQVLLAPLKEGQPVLANQLVKDAAIVSSQSAFLPLPTGYVAATLPTNELAGVAGNVKAGDYINVLAIVNPHTAGAANIRTIYPGLHVVTVGIASEQPAPAATAAGSLTVAVTECQAEFLNWFLANAALKYTLLSAEDYRAAAVATPDAACPATGSKGVTEADIKARWPGLIAP